MTLDLSKKTLILEKREARYHRSKKLSRILFYAFMVSTTATLRLNPELAANIAAYSNQTSDAEVEAEAEETVANLEPKPHLRDRQSGLPKDRVKVRRGIGNDQIATVPDS